MSDTFFFAGRIPSLFKEWCFIPKISKKNSEFIENKYGDSGSNEIKRSTPN